MGRSRRSVRGEMDREVERRRCEEIPMPTSLMAE